MATGGTIKAQREVMITTIKAQQEVVENKSDDYRLESEAASERRVGGSGWDLGSGIRDLGRLTVCL